MADDALAFLLAAAQRAAPTVPTGLVEDLAEGESIHGPLPIQTSHLLNIYDRRLTRWRTKGVPNCDGMPEFVEALRDERAAQVQLCSFTTPRNTWLILLGQDSTSIDAAIRINNPPRTPPSPDAIARGEWPP